MLKVYAHTLNVMISTNYNLLHLLAAAFLLFVKTRRYRKKQTLYIICFKKIFFCFNITLNIIFFNVEQRFLPASKERYFKIHVLVVKLDFFLFMETIVKWTVFAYDKDSMY